MLKLVASIEAILLQLGTISGFATLAITLIVVCDVGFRTVLNAPIDGAVELSELLLVILVYLGLAAAQQQRQNFAIDVATRHLPAKLQVLIEAAGYAFCIAIVAALAWPSSKQAFSSFERGEAGFGLVAFPLWPARAILAIGLWLLALQFAIDLARLVAGKERHTTNRDLGLD